MIEIIDAPFDLCGRQVGSRLGPMAMRLAGLGSALDSMGVPYTLGGSAVELVGDRPSERQEIYDQAVPFYSNLKSKVSDAIKRGNLPLVVGGDHSLSIGSISGALNHYPSGLAVLWIDAHMDLNRPVQSPSGNLHGMPLAALSRLTDGADIWHRLLHEVVPSPGLTPEGMMWLALRDVDKGEVDNLKELNGALALTMQDVDEVGVLGCMNRIFDHLAASGCTHLWVSFDVDSLDPVFAPGTGTAVRGGLSYREGHLIAETLRRMLDRSDATFELAGLDVVEVNPLQDQKNETAHVAVEWVSSLFGKRVLGGLEPGRIER